MPVSPVAVGLSALAMVTAGLALGGALGLSAAIEALALDSWTGDPTSAIDAARATVPALASVLIAAWSGAVVVGLIQSRGRLATPGRRREPERRLRRVLEVALALMAAPAMVLLLFELLPFLDSAIGVPLRVQAPALQRAMLGTLGALAVAAVVLGLAHALLRRWIWWRALHVDDATHRRERRSDATSEHIVRERRRRWREHRRASRSPAHLVLVVVDPATSRTVGIAFHPTRLSVPHVAMKGVRSDEAFASLDAHIVEDGPLARALAHVGDQRPVPDRHFSTVAEHFFATGVYVLDSPERSAAKNDGGSATNV